MTVELELIDLLRIIEVIRGDNPQFLQPLGADSASIAIVRDGICVFAG